MSTLLRLYIEFFKTGLFAVGGGMATLPFLKEIGEKTGWYTYQDMMNMLAVSESTPGPIGINMATYCGFTVAGVPGSLMATIGEITPSLIVIMIVAGILQKFRTNKYVNNGFYGLRPASTGLIGAACISVFLEVIFSGTGAIPVKWNCLILAAALWFMTNKIKKTKKLHPIFFIIISAVVGIVFKF